MKAYHFSNLIVETAFTAALLPVGVAAWAITSAAELFGAAGTRQPKLEPAPVKRAPARPRQLTTAQQAA